MKEKNLKERLIKYKCPRCHNMMIAHCFQEDGLRGKCLACNSIIIKKEHAKEILIRIVKGS